VPRKKTDGIDYKNYEKRRQDAVPPKPKARVEAKQSGERLEVTIRNRKPVGLTDLTLALLAVGQQYERFVETELPPNIRVSSTLLIKEVRSGSIVFDLITDVALPVVPLLWQGGSLSEWVKVASEVLKYFAGKLDSGPKDFTRIDLRQWDSILEPIAKDNGSQMNFVVHNGGIVQQFIVNSADANAAQNQIRKELAEFDEPVNALHRKQVMTWYQARFDSETHVGDRVILENVSRKPLRVVFDSNAIKDAMFAQGAHFGVSWHKLAYVVDVQIQTIEERPRVAVVMKFYPELTFDPSHG
jgi:hypothetical protein